MKPLAPVAAVALVLSATSAGSAGPPRVIPEEAARRCPEVMRGVSLAFRPFSGGIAIDFTSPRHQQVLELREQLREAALVVEHHLSASVSDRVRLPPLDISVSDLGAGARVTIRTQRARDLPELLELAQTLKAIWSQSDCHEELRARRPTSLPSLRA